MAKRKKKRRIKVKNILICFIILFGIGGLFYYAIHMPVKNIYIIGNQIVSDEEVLKMSTLEEYPSFLLTKKSTIISYLKKNQYIESVRVKKKFGNIIEVYIKEYDPIAVNKNNQLILSNGVLLENAYNLSDFPLLINEIQDKKIYLNFCKKLSRVHDSILRQISEIEYAPVEVDQDRFLLYMNDSNLVYITLTRINKLNYYNGIKDKLNGSLGTIYLDAGDYMEVRR